MRLVRLSSFVRLGSVVALMAIAPVGCSLEGDNTSAADGQPLGTVQLALLQAPSNLSCLRITVTGNITSVQFVSVAPGASTQITLSGLPTGAVTVRADGFSTACSAVTATSVPAWVSNNVTATLVAGVSSTIALTMTANGTATVQVNFPTPTATTTDTTPPTLASFTPPNGSTNVAESAAIVGTFSEPVNLASITPATFVVTDGSLVAPGNYTTLGNTAAFVPAPALGPAQTYAAHINPGVRDLAGNALVTGASWTFRTQDGAWDSSTILASTSTAAVGVASGRGPGAETFAIWGQSNGSNTTIFAGRFVSGSGLTGIQSIETTAQNSLVETFSIVVDLAGNATAIWAEFLNNGGERVVASHFTASVGWSAAQVLDSSGAAPSLVVDPTGVVTAAWLSISENAIVASQLTAVGWGTPVVLQAGDQQGVPVALAVDPSGNVMAVWTSSGVWADRFVPGSGWGAPRLIQDDSNGADEQKVVADPAGNVIALWAEFGASSSSVFANRFVPATGWGTPQIIDNVTGELAQEPAMGVDSNGNVVAIWMQGTSTITQVAANRFLPTSGWGTAQVIASLTGSDSLFSPVLTVDGAGNAMAAWNNSSFGVQVDRFTPATGWGQPQAVFTNAGNFLGQGLSTTDPIFNPMLTVDGIGRVSAIFADDGSNGTVPILDRFE